MQVFRTDARPDCTSDAPSASCHQVCASLSNATKRRSSNALIARLKHLEGRLLARRLLRLDLSAVQLHHHPQPAKTEANAPRQIDLHRIGIDIPTRRLQWSRSPRLLRRSRDDVDVFFLTIARCRSAPSTLPSRRRSFRFRRRRFLLFLKARHVDRVLPQLGHCARRCCSSASSGNDGGFIDRRTDSLRRRGRASGGRERLPRLDLRRREGVFARRSLDEGFRS